MGWLDGTSTVSLGADGKATGVVRSRSRSRTRRSKSRSRSNSPTYTIRTTKSHKSDKSHKSHRDKRPGPATGNSFTDWAAGLGGAPAGYNTHKNKSTSSFFVHDNRSGVSAYKRSSRKPFLARAYKKFKKLIKKLVYWLKRHPVKVFFLVIMPLITGGALGALLKKFGLRLPGGLQGIIGMVGGRGFGGGGGGGGVDGYVKTATYSGPLNMANLGKVPGVIDGVSSAVNLAKMFM
jgi:hypothetical protein